MSTVLEQTPAVPAGPASAPTRSGSLLRAELHRFRARRFMRVLLGLFLLLWLAALAIALTQYGETTAADRAAAQELVDQYRAEDAQYQAECRTDDNRPDDVSVEEYCGPAQDLRVEDFVDTAPFDLGSSATGGAIAFGAASAVFAFLAGATWIGAEWSKRSIVALLFWVPRRVRVMATKIGALVLVVALFGVLAQGLWLAMAGTLQALVGSDASLPQGFWSELLATQGRAVLLCVLTALGGFGLTNLVRNTGAALGIGFVYFAIVEGVLAGFLPSWQPWLLTTNVLGLIVPEGYTVFIYDNADYEAAPTEYLITNLQGGVLLTAFVAVVVGIGVALFARRDIQ